MLRDKIFLENFVLFLWRNLLIKVKISVMELKVIRINM